MEKISINSIGKVFIMQYLEKLDIRRGGRTLATAFKHDSKTYIVVTLNEKDDWNIHELLGE